MKTIATIINVLNCCSSILSLPVLIPASILEEYPGNHIIQNDTSTSSKVTGLLEAVEFMKKFGYLEKGDGTADYIISENGLRDKLKLVQKFGAIPQTGELDGATIKLMNSPRCGVEDVEEANPRRRKRFIVGSSGWNKRKLTYYVANWSGKLWSKENVQKELRKAFDAWAKYSYLQFTEVNSNEADIIIFFASYNHYDGYPFDGMGGTLAHAYYPYQFQNYGGDIHFDDSEDWVIKPKDEHSGLEFFSVAVHEIGHSLGLGHSPVQSSIMFPYYKGTQETFALGYDDIMGMWDLYIRRRLEGDDEYFNTTTQQPSTTPIDTGFQNDEPITTLRSTCSDHDCGNERHPETSTETIINYHGDSKTVDEHEKQFGGKEPHVPSLPPLQPDREHTTENSNSEDKRQIELERRRREEERIREEWEKKRREEERRRYEEERRRYEEEKKRREVEGSRTTDVTSTTTNENLTPPNICEGTFDSVAKIRGEIVIFKGKFAWRYYRKMDAIPGNPVLISSLFQGLPLYLQKVDAVYERRNDSNIVFFIGKYYYVHDGRQLLSEANPITNYGLPQVITQIDAIFQWPKNNLTYLFSQDLYWRRNDVIDKMDDNYPKSISRWNGIPQNVDAVVTDTYDITYFLQGGYTWSYDDALVAPHRKSPQRTTDVWVAC